MISSTQSSNSRVQILVTVCNVWNTDVTASSSISTTREKQEMQMRTRDPSHHFAQKDVRNYPLSCWLLAHVQKAKWMVVLAPCSPVINCIRLEVDSQKRKWSRRTKFDHSGSKIEKGIWEKEEDGSEKVTIAPSPKQPKAKKPLHLKGTLSDITQHLNHRVLEADCNLNIIQ